MNHETICLDLLIRCKWLEIGAARAEERRSFDGGSVREAEFRRQPELMVTVAAKTVSSCPRMSVNTCECVRGAYDGDVG